MGNDWPKAFKAVRLGTEEDDTWFLRGLWRRLKIPCLWTWSVGNSAGIAVLIGNQPQGKFILKV